MDSIKLFKKMSSIFKSGVNIQIKAVPQRKGDNYSKSITIYGIGVNEAFNRIKFMFSMIAKSPDNEVVIKHYKTRRNEDEQKTNETIE